MFLEYQTQSQIGISLSHLGCANIASIVKDNIRIKLIVVYLIMFLRVCEFRCSSVTVTFSKVAVRILEISSFKMVVLAVSDRSKNCDLHLFPFRSITLLSSSKTLTSWSNKSVRLFAFRLKMSSNVM